MRNLKVEKNLLYLRTQDFYKAIAFAEQHREIDGVENLLTLIEKNYFDYTQNEMPRISTQNKYIEIMYNIWKNLSRIMRVTGLITIILTVFIIVFIVSNMQGIIVALFYIMYPLFFIVFLMMFIVEFVYRKIYLIYTKRLEKKDYKKSLPYLDKNDAYDQEVDALYLSSLSVHDREAILLRRETAKYHEEMIQFQLTMQERQDQYYKNMLELQSAIKKNQDRILQSNQNSNEENKIAREISAELLKIEKERENRRNKKF